MRQIHLVPGMGTMERSGTKGPLKGLGFEPKVDLSYRTADAPDARLQRWQRAFAYKP
jgi:hypothetical protein